MTILWKIFFTKKAEKEFAKLEALIQKRIYAALKEKLEVAPERHLKSLTGNKKGSYKFRVGDYRLICKKEDAEIVILVIKVRHRKDVYR